MLRGQWRDQTLGSGTDAWKYWAELRAGNITPEDWCEIEDGIARSHGHCMTMGTASTMTAITETLGLTLPGASSIPASDARHWRMAAESGRQAVENAWTDLNPSKFLRKSAFENAIVADMAVGGSTNAIVHLIAMAGRAGIKLPLEDFDTISRKTPRLADLRPAGRFLMEDFYFAGGLPATLAQLLDLLDGDCPTVNGKTLKENVADAKIWNPEVIRTRENAISPEGGTAVLRGNLCRNGAVIKHSAMEPRFLKHTGPAVVFANYPDLAKRLDDPALHITADSVMVLQSAGPIGAPGMPEWGMLPLPKKLLEAGVRDLLRITDARMSGTSYGACILHVAPESAIGGPLALVRDGDLITLDVDARTLTLEVSNEELARRRGEWKAPAPHYERGYGVLYLNEVTQADEGCDFRFLHANGKSTPEPAIH
jgi:dihydroxy-acid dehydratase